MRRASCRSVPTMCRPPISATLRPSSFIFSLASMSSTVCFHSSSGTSSRVAILVLEARPGQRLRVAAEDDVGAAAGHVGGDRHGADAAGLGHDLGLAGRVLGHGVEQLVLDAAAA